MAAVESLVKNLTVEAGTNIVEEGTRGTELYVLVEGTVEISVRGMKVAERGPGAFFGEISLLDGGPRSATVTAATDVRLAVVRGRDLPALVRAAPTMALRMLRELAGRLREAQSSTVDV
jgi:CRP-like cAMP-binding protein